MKEFKSVQDKKKFTVLMDTSTPKELTEEEKVEGKKDWQEKEQRMLSRLESGKPKIESTVVINVEPAPNRVLIELFKEPDIKSQAGLTTKLDGYRQTLNFGKIVALGLETPEKPQIYPLGKYVYFPKNATTIPYQQEGKEYKVVLQHDIYMTVKDPSKLDSIPITVNETEPEYKI